MPKKALPKLTKKRSAPKPTASPAKALTVRRAPVATTTRKSSGKLAVTPKQVFPTASASYAASHPEAMPFLLLFGTAGVALSVAATLALDALRPAARAFGARLERAFAPDAKTPDEAAGVLRMHIESSPNAQRATLEGVRRLLDSIAPEAAEPLADLTAEYASGDKPVDGFFRGAARLLADLTSEELDALAELLEKASSATELESGEPLSLMYWDRGNGSPGPNRLYFRGPTEIDNPERPGHTTTWRIIGVLDARHDVHVLRIIQQLKVNGLADDPVGAWGVSDSRLMSISGLALSRLSGLLPVTGRATKARL